MEIEELSKISFEETEERREEGGIPPSPEHAWEARMKLLEEIHAEIWGEIQNHRTKMEIIYG